MPHVFQHAAICFNRSGELPAPLVPKIVGRYLFDRMRDLNTIRKFLDNSYANRAAFDEELVQQIRDCTEGSGGHAAFASILWSPPVGSVKVRYCFLYQII